MKVVSAYKYNIHTCTRNLHIEIYIFCSILEHINFAHYE